MVNKLRFILIYTEIALQWSWRQNISRIWGFRDIYNNHIINSHHYWNVTNIKWETGWEVQKKQMEQIWLKRNQEKKCNRTVEDQFNRIVATFVMCQHQRKKIANIERTQKWKKRNEKNIFIKVSQWRNSRSAT